MGNLHTLALGSEEHRVITHHIASTHGSKADGLRIARTGLPFTAIHSHL